MHVPKCAGRSIHVSLSTVLPPGAMSPKGLDTSTLCCGFQEFDSLDPEMRAALVVGDDELRELSDYAVVSGHFSLATLLRATSAASVATVLREPRARLLSFYAFWRLSSSIRMSWRGYPAPDHALRPLDEFLAEPQLAPATDNLICRMLLAPDPRIPDLDFIAPEHVDELAAHAIAALEALGFVGVLDLGDSIWAGLSDFFGVSLTPTRVNTTAAHGLTADVPDANLRITAHTLDLIDARTASDAIVYRHALAGEGYSSEWTERSSAAAFAEQLVRLGDVAGATASQLRGRVRRKDVELKDRDDALRSAREGLAGKEAELGLHRSWLDAIQGSTSWRVTAPVRGAKRALMKLRT